MTSSANKTVLAVVARRPTYGAGVLEQLRRWSIDPDSVPKSSVYSALARLEHSGLVEPRGPAPAGTDRQPRMTYGATAAGQRVVDDWFSSAPMSYDELRIRIALARPSDLERLIGFVTRAQTTCLNQLAEMGAPLPAKVAGKRRSWEAQFGAILGTMDAAELAGRVQWLDAARRALISLRDEPGERRTSR